MALADLSFTLTRLLTRRAGQHCPELRPALVKALDHRQGRRSPVTSGGRSSDSSVASLSTRQL